MQYSHATVNLILMAVDQKDIEQLEVRNKLENGNKLKMELKVHYMLNKN